MKLLQIFLLTTIEKTYSSSLENFRKLKAPREEFMALEKKFKGELDHLIEIFEIKKYKTFTFITSVYLKKVTDCMKDYNSSFKVIEEKYKALERDENDDVRNSYILMKLTIDYRLKNYDEIMDWIKGKTEFEVNEFPYAENLINKSRVGFVKVKKQIKKEPKFDEVSFGKKKSIKEQKREAKKVKIRKIIG